MIELETIPKGWTIAKFEDLLDYIQPTNYIVTSTEYKDNYPTPVLTAGKSFIKGYTNETDGIFTKLPTIIFDDFTTATQFVNFPFKVKSSAMKILQPTCDLVNIKLAYYYMQTIHLKGETHKRFWISEYSQMPVPIAPLNEQKRIIAKLEQLLTDLDKGIEYLETTKQQLKVYRESVLKWAFEGKLTNKDVKDGELPKGWTKTTLGEIVRKVSIKALPTEMPESKFIGMDCIESNALKPFMTYQFNQFKSAGNSFKVNHVLYGRMRPYLNKVYKAEFDGVCSGEFIIMECLNDFNPELLKYILHQRDFVRFANQKTSGDRPRVSFEELAEYPIFKCSPVEQNLIVQEIESRLSVCDKIEETIESSLQQAEALRLSIIKKAFEGKLVPQDSNDEPAEKLLERIRAAKGNGKPEKKEKVAKSEKSSKLKHATI
ncbi:Restriction endonuclease S subunit [Parapedobacter composti]|uniref:Restriction endonuclease S subunit n=1 Tax=Parapedobacter composti TaxID=623281 RepID=A0A1I1MGC2_9SPHI|nr:restriction endonuclease subunit S [Parapedobacter composti]SFC84449.1 Restriction endonuclease S subunit [Parapedobacter composti]